MKKFDMPKLADFNGFEGFEEFQVECARVRWQNADSSDSRAFYWKEYQDRKKRYEDRL